MCQGKSRLLRPGNQVTDAVNQVLPPTLTHPSVSLMTLVIRDPENFHAKPYSVPKLEDLRLFTSGSDSTDLVERCLSSGRILVSHPISMLPACCTQTDITVDIPHPVTSTMVNVGLTHPPTFVLGDLITSAPFSFDSNL
jgi:U3 small nucleolar RNA-associated protein 4